MERIQHAGYTILQELEIAQMMDTIEEDMKKNKELKDNLDLISKEYRRKNISKNNTLKRISKFISNQGLSI